MTPYLQDADCTLYHGDVLAVLPELEAESVDCVVTSPPYWGLRDYGNEGQLGLEPTPEEYVTRMVEVFREVRRVLAPHGTVWLNLGDSYATTPPGKVSDPFKTSGLAGIGGAKYRADRTALREKNMGKDFAGLKQKDLVGIPWRVAFALQADGWYLRSDIIWAKPNPMPESVTDRPTKAHEYVFLLSKQPKYFFDQEAVREEAEYGFRRQTGEMRSVAQHGRRHTTGTVTDFRSPPQDATLDGSEGESPRGPDGRRKTTVQGADGSIQHRDGERWPNGGRNIRSVWSIATQPYPDAHFATFPEELARRCIAAGCPDWVCRVCGKARERIVSATYDNEGRTTNGPRSLEQRHETAGFPVRKVKTTSTEGFTDCGHSDYRVGIVLDPFMGSGTVAYVARKLARHSIGIDLNESYLALAAKRLQQQSLFAEV